MNRDENFDQVHVELMAKELDRLLDKYTSIMDWDDRLEAASLVSNRYGKQLSALDAMFSRIIPKHKEMQADPEIRDLAITFIEFGDRYNKGPKGGQPFDVRSLQGPSLNELRLLVRDIIREA